MSKLGNIDFSEYDSDDIVGYNINSSESTTKSFSKCKELDIDSKHDINNLDSVINKKSNKCIQKTINNNILSDCEIITYDNSKEIQLTKSSLEETCPNKKTIKKKKGEDIESIFCSSNFFEDVQKNVKSSDILESNNFYDGYNVKTCPDNIVAEKKYEKKSMSISKINELDIICEKLDMITKSLQKVSHLIQYYIRIIEETKIQISQLDMSQSVTACCETTTSLFTFLKAEIERNKPFVMDDKYHNREGYYLNNGYTKIYYIEKIQMKLFDSGECIFGLFEDSGRIKTYELGDKYIDANYEGDLYSLLDTAKDKANYFNQMIEAKYIKASSIYNLYIIYLDKHKQ